jgi:Uma2 family endonuclease
MATATVESVPPLVPGEKLTRVEFLRRWEAAPRIKLAELIKGIVYMPSPLSVDHGEMDLDLGGWLFHYRAATPGTKGAHNATTFLLEDAPQPDVSLRILPEYGGTSSTEDKYLSGPPEFVAEVCATSAAIDLHDKLDLYQEARVREYLAVLVNEREIRWHILVNDCFEILQPDADGIWRSRVFPGLWLDGQALLQGNVQQVIARLDEGLRSPEHVQFVKDLAARKR